MEFFRSLLRRMHRPTLLAILTPLLLQPLSHAQDWRSYALWNPREGTTASSFAIIYQGRYYENSLLIHGGSQTIDHASPENVVEGLLTAINHEDASWYDHLFTPGETHSRFYPDAKNVGSTLLLRRLIQWDGYSILSLSLSNSLRHFPLLFCLRNLRDAFFATDALETNQAFALLNYYYAFTTLTGRPMEKELPNTTFSEAGYIYFTNSIGRSLTSPSLIFRFQGKRFAKNSVLAGCSGREKADLSSPTGTLAAAFGALERRDVDWYADLLHPEERTNTVRYGIQNAAKGLVWEQWMRRNFENALSRGLPAKVRLVGEVFYGENIILTFADAGEGSAHAEGWICLRKHGSEWFISDKLNGSPNPLVNYLGISRDLRTKVFPILQSGS